MGPLAQAEALQEVRWGALMNPHMLGAVRALRRLLHVHRDLFERLANGAECDEALGPSDPSRAELAAFQLRMELADQVAGRFGVGLAALDLAVIESELVEHKRRLEAIRRREGATDFIRSAIDRASADFLASIAWGFLTRCDMQLVAVVCQECKTELAFPGDVCGLCKPGEVADLH